MLIFLEEGEKMKENVTYLQINKKILDESFLKVDMKKVFPVPPIGKDIKFYEKIVKDIEDNFYKKYEEIIFGKPVTVEINDKSKEELIKKFNKLLVILEKKNKEEGKKNNLWPAYQDSMESGEPLVASKVWPNDPDIVNALNVFIKNKKHSPNEDIDAEEKCILKIADVRFLNFGRGLDLVERYLKDLKR